MKKFSTSILFFIVFAACRKGTVDMPAGNSITGKWNIISVTLVPLDSLARTINNGAVYTEPPYYYFQFNANNTWVENLAADTTSGISETGSYMLYASTSFTLTNDNAQAKSVNCNIDSLTSTLFVFSFRRPTLFNGITPGYLKYIFQLKK